MGNYGDNYLWWLSPVGASGHVWRHWAWWHRDHWPTQVMTPGNTWSLSPRSVHGRGDMKVNCLSSFLVTGTVCIMFKCDTICLCTDIGFRHNVVLVYWNKLRINWANYWTYTSGPIHFIFSAVVSIFMLLPIVSIHCQWLQWDKYRQDLIDWDIGTTSLICLSWHEVSCGLGCCEG